MGERERGCVRKTGMKHEWKTKTKEVYTTVSVLKLKSRKYTLRLNQKNNVVYELERDWIK
jgi:hypothetical protein